MAATKKKEKTFENYNATVAFLTKMRKGETTVEEIREEFEKHVLRIDAIELELMQNTVAELGKLLRRVPGQEKKVQLVRMASKLSPAR